MLSDCYSTEEKEVGCWHNGKPIYQKVVNFGALPNATSKTVAHGISNLEDVVNVFAFAYDTNRENFLPLNFCSTSQQNLPYQAGGYVTKDNVRIDTGSNRSTYTAYVVIQYTKSTDTAGSGQYTPASGKAIHYSTDEQVIGTWIDGSTLYRKVIDCGALPNATSKAVAHGISNLGRICKYDCTAINTNDNVGFTPPMPISLNNTTSNLIVTFDATNINFNTGINLSTYNDCKVILEYTKTV